ADVRRVRGVLMDLDSDDVHTHRQSRRGDIGFVSDVRRLGGAADGRFRKVPEQNRSGRVGEVISEHFAAVDVDDDAIVAHSVQPQAANIGQARDVNLLAEVGGRKLEVSIGAELYDSAFGARLACEISITQLGNPVGPARIN